ncbi:hypothetical protein SAMN04487860_11741 [Ruminococcus flavefaciens]|uniref:YcxB-like protein n=1 Tax=Ruminococcus flavefaciens TaxID=1265 RepID=A0A1M7LZH1_RUMFL|nr:hypothetical protein SAMN04487860_11741 [Ruminococcus flavefaciens]
MIVNKTKYTEKDFDFVYSRGKHSTKYYFKLSTSLIFDFFALIYSLYLLRRVLKFKAHLVLTPLSFLLIGLVVYSAVRTIYRTLTRKKSTIAAWVKQEEICTDRTMTFVKDGIIVSSVKNGLLTDTKYGFDLVKGYISTDGCLYIRTVLTDNSEIYMILHDNCYTEGSKAEAIERLKAVGAAEESV